MNSVNVTGRWVTDFTKKSVGDKTVAEARLAVQVSKDVAHFFDVKAWEKTAEIAEQYCKKGSVAIVSGRLAQESWEKDGEKRSKVLIIAERIDLPPLPPRDGDDAAKPAAKKSAASSKATVADDDSDLF